MMMITNHTTTILVVVILVSLHFVATHHAALSSFLLELLCMCLHFFLPHVNAPSIGLFNGSHASMSFLLYLCLCMNISMLGFMNQ